MTLFLILFLVSIAGVGGILTVCKAGEEDGISDYGYIEE